MKWMNGKEQMQLLNLKIIIETYLLSQALCSALTQKFAKCLDALFSNRFNVQSFFRTFLKAG